MALMDYVGIGDKFEADESSSGLSFPCCVCVHRHGLDTEEPCRTCCHNANCVNDPEHKFMDDVDGKALHSAGF